MDDWWARASRLQERRARTALTRPRAAFPPRWSAGEPFGPSARPADHPARAPPELCR